MFQYSYGASRQTRQANYTDSLAVYSASYVQKRNLEHGNKILLPSSALAQLIHFRQKGPMIFRVSSTLNNKATYAGVLEFVAEEGSCVLPDWMFNNMGFFEGCIVMVNMINDLPIGKLIKIQPHETAFIDLPDPRAVLENCLRNFICLTEGETINIDFSGNKYQIDIVKVDPVSQHKAVNINEADVEIDFLPPLDYSEAPPNLIKKPSSLSYEEASKKQSVFQGQGVRIDGKSNVVPRKPSEDVKVVEPYNPRKHKLTNGIKPQDDPTLFTGTSTRLGQTKQQLGKK